jgi:hypothetical protein
MQVVSVGDVNCTEEARGTIEAEGGQLDHYVGQATATSVLSNRRQGPAACMSHNHMKDGSTNQSNCNSVATCKSPGSEDAQAIGMGTTVHHDVEHAMHAAIPAQASAGLEQKPAEQHAPAERRTQELTSDSESNGSHVPRVQHPGSACVETPSLSSLHQATAAPAASLQLVPQGLEAIHRAVSVDQALGRQGVDMHAAVTEFTSCMSLQVSTKEASHASSTPRALSSLQMLTPRKLQQLRTSAALHTTAVKLLSCGRPDVTSHAHMDC